MTRDINQYFPFKLEVNVIPMLFIHNLDKKFLTVEIKTYLDELEFNENNGFSEFLPLCEKITFSGSMYESLVNESDFSTDIAFLSQKAKEFTNFQENDRLLEITINSEETYVEVRRERLLDENTNTLDSDLSDYYGVNQGKFDKLKVSNPELVQLYYSIVLRMFAIKQGVNQRFYQKVLQSVNS